MFQTQNLVSFRTGFTPLTHTGAPPWTPAGGSPPHPDPIIGFYVTPNPFQHAVYCRKSLRLITDSTMKNGSS